MKSKKEIEQLAIKHANLKSNFDRAEEEYYNSGAINAYESFIKGYTQCQKDNDWTKGCECESSIGQTWCCNQCGLPYDTRKTYKNYTEADMREAFNKGALYGSEHLNTYYFEELINSLNKQDNEAEDDDLNFLSNNDLI